MEKTSEVLSNIYKNVKMGSEAILAVLPKIKDTDMMSDLTAQLNGYEGLAGRAQNQLSAMNIQPKEEGILRKLPLHASITMNTLADSSSGRIAEMVMQGSNMNIIEMTRTLNFAASAQCAEEALVLGRDVITFEEDNIKKLSRFL